MKGPQWMISLLEKVIVEDLQDEVIGDLLERYYIDQEEKGARKAQILMVVAAIKYARTWRMLQLRSSNKSTTSMGIWRNYFLASMRNLMRHKRYTAISLLGLIIGFAVTMAIMQYVSYENSYDKFYPHQDIYRLTHTFTNNSGASESASTLMAVRNAIRANVPEVKHVTHLMITGGLIKVDDQVFDDNQIIGTNSDFFEVFGIKLLRGNAKDLDKPESVFLSESNAIRYFGTTDVLGKTIEMQGIFGETWNAAIEGIFEDVPDNAHLSVETMFSGTKLHNLFKEEGRFGAISAEDIPWRFLGFHTYLIPETNVSKEAIVDKTNQLIATYREKINRELDQKHEVWLQPVEEIHTTAGIIREITPTNDGNTIQLFGLLAGLVLVIAWINYINISTAKAVTRGKEVGVRKVLGSGNGQLRNQFLLEAFLLNIFSFIIALLILIPAIPFLDDIVGVNFMGQLYANQEVMLIGAGVLIIGSLASGWYPAWVLANYDCLKVLKGKIQYSSSGIYMRRILVVVQFVFSIFLISALLIVQSQMNFMLNSNLGVNIDQTFLINAPINLAGQDNYTTRMQTLLNDYHAMSGVDKVSTSSIVPGIQNGWRASIERRTEGAGMFIHRSIVDDGYLDLYDLKIVAGTNFEQSSASEQQSLLVNETSRKRLGYQENEDILKEHLFFGGEEFVVIGVVGDFYQQGIHNGYEPLSFSPDTALLGNFISVKVNSANVYDLVSNIEQSYRNIFPDAPYNGRFLDDVFQDQYAAQFRFRDLFTLFAGITLVIACLGLIGLSSYMINLKMNEVSIRKVLGASGSGLFLLLNREYFVLTVTAFLIATPAIYFLSPLWLQQFENRISVHPGFYFIALSLILVIVLVTTLSHTMRAIMVNPAKMLKEE